MTKVTIDTALQKTLEGALGPIQVYSPEGTSLGYFVPSFMGMSEALTGWELSPEELERRKREGGYITTAELMRRLETL